jgi:hypothetical protein
MTFYKQIEKIFPYLKSVRKLKTYLSFDIEIPSSWKIPKKFIIQDKVVEQEKAQQNMRLFSFISEFNEDDVTTTIGNIKSIIDYNKELEEKELLFINKVEELKKIFEKQNLDKLQKLKFDIKEYNLNGNEEREGKADELASK